jgi:hypothetical protein
VTVEGYKLVVDENRAWFEQGERVLSNKRDILNNIARCPKISGYDRLRFIRALVWGVFGFFLGVTIIVACLEMLWETSESESVFTSVAVALLLIPVGAFCLLGFGYTNFATCVAICTRLRYAKVIFQALLDRGQIAEGRVVYIRLTDGRQQEINYVFELPGEDKRIEGSFVTSSQEDFGDCPVAVLYLNKYMHILL